jgi:hypothetical protein
VLHRHCLLWDEPDLFDLGYEFYETGLFFVAASNAENI